MGVPLPDGAKEGDTIEVITLYELGVPRITLEVEVPAVYTNEAIPVTEVRIWHDFFGWKSIAANKFMIEVSTTEDEITTNINYPHRQEGGKLTHHPAGKHVIKFASEEWHKLEANKSQPRKQEKVHHPYN